MGVRWSCISASDSLTLHLVEDMQSRWCHPYWESVDTGMQDQWLRDAARSECGLLIDGPVPDDNHIIGLALLGQVDRIR